MSYESVLNQGFDFEGTDDDDVFQGTGVTDRVEGRDGNDFATTGEGDDVLRGGSGDDLLDGGVGDDVMDGGDGNDILYGREGNDVLIGGAGNNSLQGGEGDDSIFAGDGDTVIDAQGSNHLDLTAYTALTTANAEITQFQADGGDIYLNIHVRDSAHPSVTPDTGGVSVQGELANFGTITLNSAAGGTTTMTSDQFTEYVAVGLIINGTAGADTIFGTDADDTIRGLNGADKIDAGAGSDRIDGGSGNDTLIGDAGNDTYLLAYNSGRDTIIESGDAGSTNTIQLDGGVAFAMLRSSRSGNDLRIDVDGTSDGVLVKDFYIQPQAWQDAWTLIDGEGNTLGVAGVTPAVIPSAADWLGSLADSFKVRREQVFAAGLAADGFTLFGSEAKRVDHGFSFNAGQTTSTTNITSLRQSDFEDDFGNPIVIGTIDARAVVRHRLYPASRCVGNAIHGRGSLRACLKFPARRKWWSAQSIFRPGYRRNRSPRRSHGYARLQLR